MNYTPTRMDRLSRSEYLVCRRTIATRGALRPILVLAGLGIWGALLTAVLVLIPYSIASVIPLLVLVATFEIIRPLHFGVERIGRYLQVFYEERGEPDRPLTHTPAWERVAMQCGRVPGAGGHPLFAPLFLLATITNYLAVLLPGPATIELAALAVPHLSFVAWLIVSDRAMRRQRDIELARFRALRESAPADRR